MAIRGGAQYWGSFVPQTGGAQYFPASFVNGTPPAAPPAAASPAAAPPATVAPYLTPQDIQNIINERSAIQGQLADLAKSLTDLKANTEYQLAQGQKQAAVSSQSATDDAIARGLFQSSVKDASLYDIAAQQAMNSQFLQDAFSRAVADAQTRQNNLSQSWSQFQSAMLQQAVQNAQAANSASGASGFAGTPPDLTAAFGSIGSLTTPTLNVPGAQPQPTGIGPAPVSPGGTESPIKLPPATPAAPGITPAPVPGAGGLDVARPTTPSQPSTPQPSAVKVATGQVMRPGDAYLTALKATQRKAS